MWKRAKLKPFGNAILEIYSLYTLLSSFSLLHLIYNIVLYVPICTLYICISFCVAEARRCINKRNFWGETCEPPTTYPIIVVMVVNRICTTHGATPPLLCIVHAGQTRVCVCATVLSLATDKVFRALFHRKNSV